MLAKKIRKINDFASTSQEEQINNFFPRLVSLLSCRTRSLGVLLHSSSSSRYTQVSCHCYPTASPCWLLYAVLNSSLCSLFVSGWTSSLLSGLSRTCQPLTRPQIGTEIASQHAGDTTLPLQPHTSQSSYRIQQPSTTMNMGVLQMAHTCPLLPPHRPANAPGAVTAGLAPARMPSSTCSTRRCQVTLEIGIGLLGSLSSLFLVCRYPYPVPLFLLMSSAYLLHTWW